MIGILAALLAGANCYSGQPADPAAALSARMDPTTWRLVYNNDGDSMALEEGATPTPASRQYMEAQLVNVLGGDSRVDAVTICVHARVTFYPSTVGTLRGSLTSLAQQGSELASEPTRFQNMQHFYAGNRDPYLYLIDAVHGFGRPAIMTFRVNDVHGFSFLRELFWSANPTFKLNGGDGYDFGASTQVVDHLIDILTEALARYPWDGLELDFNRTAPFFDASPSLSEAQKIAIMTDFVQRAKAVVDAEAIVKGKPMLFGVRAPADANDTTAPTPTGARAFGCDLGAWADLGLLDYAVVSRYLSNSGALNISTWETDIGNGVPVLGGVEWINGGDQQDYNDQCDVIEAEGPSGIYLFNFFASGYVSPYTSSPWAALSTMCAP